MPYKRVGKTIYSKASGKWRKKQTAKTVANAKKTIRLLRGIEHNPSYKKKLRKGRKKR